MITEGTNPKLISSARESNSFPMGEGACNTRADIPSRKSNTALIMMKVRAQSYLNSNAITHAIQPENRFRHVSVLGIWRVIRLAIV